MAANVKKIIWVSSIVIVGVIALIIRLRAVDLLPIDYDEDDYLSAAYHYAHAFQQGDLQDVIDYRYLQEHPALAKIAYALAIIDLPAVAELNEPSDPNIPPASSLPEPYFQRARTLAAVLGVLQALALAVVNPLAGLLLAINTWHTKYTSQIMLEALPSLTSLLTVLFYLLGKRAKQPGRLAGWSPWLAASAVMLGLTASGKYIYCVVGLAILVDWYMSRGDRVPVHGKPRWQWLLPVFIWGGLALLAFFASNPSLWSDPIQRLRESLLYHGGYAQSAHVQQAGYPVWQPIVWLTISVPWHPGVFKVAMDPIVTLLALFGLPRLWKQQQVFALWLGFAFVFLLIWPTKWPQYILILSAPLCLAAAHGLEALVIDPLAGAFKRWRNPEQLKVQPEHPVTLRQTLTAIPWLLPGATILTLITLFPLVYQLTMSLTDLSVLSLKDGINGGLWREVWQGLSGQIEAVEFNVFQPQRSTEVHYAGPGLLSAVFLGGLSNLVAFEVVWTVLSIGLQLTLGLSVALILNKPHLRFKRWWRMVFILPWAIPEFAGALMWLQIYDPQFGWAKQTAESLGDAAPGILMTIAGWQGDPPVALILMLITATWYGFPIMMLAATAGLKMISPAVYEAAAMDGASGWKLFRTITWPLLLPLLVPVIIIRAIFAFNQFYLFYVFSSRDYTTLSLLSFSLVGSGNYAISAAVNIFVIAVLIGLILIFNHWTRAAEGVRYA